MARPDSRNHAASADTLDTLFASPLSGEERSISSNRRSSARKVRQTFSSQFENLENRELMTADSLIPAEVMTAEQEQDRIDYLNNQLQTMVEVESPPVVLNGNSIKSGAYSPLNLHFSSWNSDSAPLTLTSAGALRAKPDGSDWIVLNFLDNTDVSALNVQKLSSGGEFRIYGNKKAGGLLLLGTVTAAGASSIHITLEQAAQINGLSTQAYQTQGELLSLEIRSAPTLAPLLQGSARQAALDEIATLQTSIESLEQRDVKTVVMGPIQAPAMALSPQEQAEVDSLHERIDALKLDIADVTKDIDTATLNLGTARTIVDADRAVVTAESASLRLLQTAADLANAHVATATTNVASTTSALGKAIATLETDIQRMNAAKRALDQVGEVLRWTFGRAARIPLQEIANRHFNEYVTYEKRVGMDREQMIPSCQKDLEAAKQNLILVQAEKERADLALLAPTAALAASTNKEAADTLLLELAQNTVDTLTIERTALQTRLDALQQELSALDAMFAANMAEEIETQRLSAELAASLQAALDAETNRIGYAKMFVSTETLPEGKTCFTIRYRVPNQHWKLNVRLDMGGGNIEYRFTSGAEPVADASWSFVLGSGNGSAVGMTFTLQDTDTGEIMTETKGAFLSYNNTPRIDTRQTDFAINEAGLLSENPITPSLTVGEIRGATLLLVVQTPNDQFYIDTPMDGMLSTVNGTSTGGTSFGLAQITVNTGRPTDDYPVNLYDRQGGMLLDTVMVHFDSNTRTLTLPDSADQYSGASSIAETDAAQKLQAQQMLQSIPIGVDDPTIANLQRLNLYHDTANLPAPYNLYMDGNTMMPLLFARADYAKFAYENQEAEIQKLWDSMGTYYEKDGTLRHSCDYRIAHDAIINGREELVKRYTDAMHKHEQGMAECMQAAVNIVLAVVQGKPESSYRLIFDNLYEKWSQDGNIKLLQDIGFGFAGKRLMLDTAKELFNAKWGYLVQTQADVVQMREREEYFLQKGMRKTADGEWIAATNEHNPVMPPEGMSAEQVRLAARIMGVIASSSDPRIRALSAIRQQQVALQMSAITTTNPVEVVQQQTQILTSIVKASAADAYVAAHSSEVNNAVQSISQQNSLSTTDSSNVFKWVQQDPELLSSAGFDGVSQGSLLSAVQNLIGGLFSIPRASAAEFDESKTVTNFDVRKDTPVGQMFLGILQQTEGVNDVSVFAGYAKELQSRTNIPWYKTAASLEVSGQSARASNLKNLFIQAGYGDIFSNAPTSDVPEVLSVAPYKIDYNAGEVVQVRFDVAVPDGYSIDHAFAYAVYNGQQLSNQPISSEIDNQMFVRIPVSNIQSQILFSHDGPVSIQIKIAVWLKRNDGLSSQMITAGGLSTAITVPENSISLTQEEMSVIDMNIPSQFVNNQKLIQSMIQNYFLGTDPNNRLEKVGDGWQAAVHGTGDRQCKRWLDEVFVINATGINIPTNASDQSSWVNDQNEHIQQVAKIDVSNNFQATIENNNIISGDIVQMLGDFDNNPKTAASPHTMMIGKIQSDGIWALDTNFGNTGTWMDDDNNHQGLLTGIIDSDGIKRKLTNEEIQNNVQGTLWYQEDNTIRYHFMSYSDLNSKVISASIYRLN